MCVCPILMGFQAEVTSLVFLKFTWCSNVIRKIKETSMATSDHIYSQSKACQHTYYGTRTWLPAMLHAGYILPKHHQFYSLCTTSLKHFKITNTFLTLSIKQLHYLISIDFIPCDSICQSFQSGTYILINSFTCFLFLR